MESQHTSVEWSELKARLDPLKPQRCCVCEVLHREEFDFYARLAQSCAQLQGASEALIVGEFCNLHAWQFAKTAASGTCSVIGHDLLAKYLQNLRDIESSGQIQGRSSEIARNCLICHFLKELETRALSEAAKDLQSWDAEGRDQNQSLCRTHFFKILGSTQSPQLRSQLVLDQINSTAILMQTLEAVVNSAALRPFAEENRIPGLAFQSLFGRPYIKDP